MKEKENSDEKSTTPLKIRACPNTIFLSFEASAVINSEYSKLLREEVNILLCVSVC